MQPGVHLRTASMLAASAIALPLSSQSEQSGAELAFEAAFVRGVRQPSWDSLRAADALTALLPDAARERARFAVTVRQAELRLRDGRHQEAIELAWSARERALQAGVYAGAERALTLVLLWQLLELDELDAWVLSDDEVAFIETAPLDGRFRALEVPIRLLRAELLYRRGRELDALRALRALADDLAARGDAVDVWRRKCLNELVWYYFVRREYQRALQFLRQLPVGDHRTFLLTNVALKIGDYDTARRGARKLARTDAKYQIVYGFALEALGNFDAARDAYREYRAHAATPIDQAIAKRSLGDCDLGEYLAGSKEPELLASARTSFEGALRVFDELGTPQAEAEAADTLRQLGRVAELEGEPSARELYWRSLRRVDRARGSIATDSFGTSWLASAAVNEYRHSVDGVLRTGTDPFDVIAAMEIAKARTLLDWAHSPPASAGELRDSVQRLAASTTPGEVERRLAALDAARVATSREATQATTLTAEQLRESVAAWPDTEFWSYWLGAEECWLVAVGPSGALTRSLGSRDDAVAHLGDSHAAVAAASEDPWPALDAAGSFFVPAEVAARLAGADRVVFCPDATVGRLPFEALRIGGRPLGVALAVERVPSLSVRAALERRAARGTGAAVVSARSSADLESFFGLDALEFAGVEGDLVERAYAEVARLTDRDGDLAHLTELLERDAFDTVHVSAHAIQQSQLPTSTLLLLADGPASLASLVSLPLRGAVLVLSACSTATGEHRGGEGDLGLLGWPIAAGARAAVVSMWHANQQATADLMGQFHAFRAAGHDSAEAMRRAREVLAAAPHYAHPHYWAAFGVVGAQRDPAGSDWTWLLLAAAALLITTAAVRRRSSAAAAPRPRAT